ncbi:MAG: alpha/beta hydrolase, partial [Bacteroidota bacterium]
MKSISIFSHQWLVILFEMILTMGSLNLQAQDYSFRIDKSGQGPDMILIPGLTCDGTVWDETVEVFAKDYTCHVLTLPGFGTQPAIDIEDSFLPIMEKEIVEYIKANKLNKPIVVGHSLGGFLAISIASHHTDLLDKIVVVDALPFLAAIMNPMATEENMKSMAKSMKEMYKNTDEATYKAQQELVLKSMIATEDRIPTAMKWSLTSDKKTVGQAMYDLYTIDLRDEVKNIKIPTLVLGAWIAYKDYGVTKEMTLANYQSQYVALEGVEIRMSDIGKHFLMWDDPKFTIGSMKEFLAQ